MFENKDTMYMFPSSSHANIFWTIKKFICSQTTVTRRLEREKIGFWEYIHWVHSLLADLKMFCMYLNILTIIEMKPSFVHVHIFRWNRKMIGTRIKSVILSYTFVGWNLYRSNFSTTNAGMEYLFVCQHNTWNHCSIYHSW